MVFAADAIERQCKRSEQPARGNPGLFAEALFASASAHP
jgi:hypothetical protein